MAPKKNKPSRNGYWQFVMSVRDKPQNRGRSLEEVQQMAAAKWKQMSAEEKAPFGQQAELQRNSYIPDKLTSDRIPIEQLEKEEKAAEDEIKHMKEDITSIINVAKLMGRADEEFYIVIHINHLCHYPTQDRYFICEIAAAAFNFRTGVQVDDVFHEIVQPGKLPLGYYGTALAHSKETHHLVELVQDEPFPDNTDEVFQTFIEFLRRYKTGDKLPPVYSPEKTLDMTRNVIREFRERFDFNTPIRVYTLEYLLFALRNASVDYTVWNSESFAYNEIERDVYEHTPNIACDFHEAGDLNKYCSRSIVIRHCFTICDLCCSDMGIPLVPGLHVPQRSQVYDGSLTASRTTSMTSVNTLGFRPRSSCSLASADFDTEFPMLGGGRSNMSTSSSATWRSMRTPRTPDDQESLAGSVQAMSVKGRDHSKLKLPKPARGLDSQ